MMGATLKRIQYLKTSSNISIIAAIVIFVFSLAVFQDYLSSKIHQTGFYMHECMLYNSFWIFFVPFTVLSVTTISALNLKKNWFGFTFFVGFGILLSLIHILLFTSFFVAISNLIYSPSHRFSAILNGVLSNYLYIVVLYYLAVPYFITLRKKSDSPSHLPNSILVKSSKIKSTLLISEITHITSEKPYVKIHTLTTNYLDARSLKRLDEILDSSIFLRVHRSTILNISYVKELKSRSNGDYDVTLSNGLMLRLSRHYRANWSCLLH